MPNYRDLQNSLQISMPDNVLLLTYDSCRLDVMQAAQTPVLDSFAVVRSAQSPANFTYAAHLAFFAGILPNCNDEIAYYNRFSKQLMGLTDMGETNVVKDSLIQLQSDRSLIHAFRAAGYQTVGAGAMNWFRQATLTDAFSKFLFTGTNANSQIDFLFSEIDLTCPFFGFINFGETHYPYSYEGKTDHCRVDVRARRMTWPPKQQGSTVGKDCPAFQHQVRAAEYLDTRLPRLFSGLPDNTIVILCADHGEAFGEDGFWGHGVNHQVILEVPLAIFRLDGLDWGEH